MSWPLSQDFNEAVQNPASAFSDPDLRTGRVVTNALGMPLPRSGNYADVYQIAGADGRSWAVKCFTRPVQPDLKERYAAIAAHLAKANLPFTVGFEFLADGIRVKGKSFPAVKMLWVDGSPLNQFVKDNLHRATILEGMLSLEVRLCRRLRETGMAHGDLQHGNVIMVPNEGRQSTLGLKLVDYDGLFVPALDGKPTGESGHASYQHPDRSRTGNYSADLDRFPHLVVATALRGLLIGGKPLWDKYDTGDNLLFTEKDFTLPAKSKLMRELWDAGDPFTVGLLAHLVLSCAKPLAQTPWIDTLISDSRPPVLTPSQERQAAQLLGVPMAVTVPAEPRPAAAPPQAAVPDLGFDAPAAPRTPQSGVALYGAVAAGVLAAIGIGSFLFFSSGGKKKPDDGGSIVSNTAPLIIEPRPVEPKPIETKPVEIPPPEITPVETKPPAPAVEPPKPGRMVWTHPVSDVPVIGRYVVYSRDGSRLFVPVSDSGQIQTFDSVTGKYLYSFRNQHQRTAQLFVAPLPGRRVLSLGVEPGLFIWDDTKGKLISKTLTRGPEGGCTALMTEQTGRYALVAASEKVMVIDLEANAEVVSFTVATGRERRPAAALAADGTQALGIAPDGTLRIYPFGKAPVVVGKLPWKIEEVESWSPAQKLVALRSLDGDGKRVLKFVNTATAAEVKTLPTITGPAEFSADGRYLVAAGRGVVHVYDTATWASVSDIPIKAPAYDLAVHPNGQRIAIVDAESKIHLLAPAEGTVAVASTTTTPVPASISSGLTEVATLPGVGLVAAALSTDGRTAYLLDTAKVRAVTLATKTDAFTFTPATGSPARLWATSAGTLVVDVTTPGKRTELHVIDGQSGQPLRTPLLLAPTEIVKFVTVSANGTMAAAVKADGKVAYFLLKDGKAAFYTISPKTPAETVALPGTGAKTILGVDKEVEIYTTAEFGPKPLVRHYASLGRPHVVEDVSADGERIAFRLPPDDGAAGTQFLLRLLPKWSTAKPVTIRSSNEAGKTALRFLPDNQRAIVLDGDLVKLVSVETGTTLGELKRTMDGAFASIAGDGTLALVGGPAGVSICKIDAAATAVARVVEPKAAPDRKPVPADADVKLAEVKIRELLKDDFAKKAPADRRKLLELLQRTAAETSDNGPAKYLLLKEAQAIAVELNDVPTAVKVIESLDAAFEVDATALKTAMLEKLGTASPTTVLRAVADAATDLIDELTDRGEFDKALKLAQVGIAALERANLGVAARALDAQKLQIKKLKDGFEPVRAALERLKTNPGDADASLVVGRYRSFQQGHWAEALPYLIAGSDAALKKAALMDTEAADGAELKIGDAWWDYAQTLSDAERGPATARARYWYAKVLAAGRVGLEKIGAENRLAFAIAGIDYKPGLVLEANPDPKGVRKIVRLVPVVEADFGDAKGSRNIGYRWSGVLVPPTAGRYKLIAETKEPALVKLFAKPEEKLLFDVRTRGEAGRRDAVLLLPERPVPILIETFGPTTKGYAFRLLWTRPGSKLAELVPPECLYHAKSAETALTEK